MAIQARTRNTIATTVILAVLTLEIAIWKTDSGAAADAVVIKIVRTLATPIGAMADHHSQDNGNG